MKGLITIDPKKIAIFVEEGGKFLFKPEAEESLEKLLEAQKMIEEAIENAKQTISAAGKELSPNFKGVRGSRIDCTLRKYGTKYKYHLNQKNDCESFLKHRDYYMVDSEKVEEYVEEVGELPEGVYEAPREEKLTISWRKNEQYVN